ncbi:hypothetical protein FACS189456_5520 [Bacteroidia bacterium]|nr:hypothetical protein FACS189456_5520 [Bacteroidia bacterium]
MYKLNLRLNYTTWEGYQEKNQRYKSLIFNRLKFWGDFKKVYNLNVGLNYTLFVCMLFTTAKL